MLARDVMTSPVVTVDPDATVADIARLLLERGISAVPVLDKKGNLCGIVSERDLLHRPEIDGERRPSGWLSIFADRSERAAEFIRSHGMHARDLMTREVVTVAPDTDVAEIARTLEVRRIKRVPVIDDDGHLVGIVSRANLLRGLVALRRGVPVVSSRSDAALREKLREDIENNEWIDTSQVNLVVRDGIVHVWGLVRSDEELHALHLAIEEIPGVKGIEDHLSPNIFAHYSA